jgi:hypothetical protein
VARISRFQRDGPGSIPGRRSLFAETMLGYANLAYQQVLWDLMVHLTVFHLLTCLELYEGVRKFPSDPSERAGLGGVPGKGSLRVVPSLSRFWAASTAIERLVSGSYPEGGGR